MEDIIQQGVTQDKNTSEQMLSVSNKRKVFLRLFFILSLLLVLIGLFSAFFVLGIYKGKESPKTISDKIVKLNKENLKDATTKGALSDEDLRVSFLDPLNRAATYSAENKVEEHVTKFSGYLSVYNQLVGQYYSTRDPKILQAAKDLREYIKNNFGDLYAVHERDNEGAWDIVE